MSNLASAQTAIQAELAHAQAGLAHYQSRIEALERTLAQLISIDGGARSVPATNAKVTIGRPTKPASAKSAKPGKLAKSPKTARKATGGKKLPFTGGDFWINLITDQPQSVSEIMTAAVNKLGITPAKSEIKKLAGRQTFALNAMVKSGQIQDSGKGRERRFFKA